MKKVKNKIKRDMVADVAWQMFEKTGIVAHYLFYKEMDKK